MDQWANASSEAEKKLQVYKNPYKTVDCSTLEVQKLTSLAAPVATLWIKQCKTNAEGSKIAPMLRTASIPKTLANPCCPEHAKTQTANATQFVFSIS